MRKRSSRSTSTVARSDQEQRPSAAWLLLDDNHAVPITDLDPDALKHAAKDTVVAPDHEIGHQTKLNAIVGHLGFRGGFAGYKAEWPALQAFMRQQDMRKPFSMFEHGLGRASRPAPGPCWWPTREEVAERIFHSGRPRPERLFVGHGFDWEPFDWYGREPTFGPAPGESERDHRARRAFQTYTEGGLHYLHDVLAQPRLDECVIICRYFTNEYPREDRERDREAALAGIADFRARIDASSAGWARVVPYNDRLVFLVLDDGRYDFVFSDLRRRPPPERPFVGNLEMQDVPGFVLTGDAVWDHWLYFRRGRWLHRDTHESEERFYARGGTLMTYPGSSVILQDLYRERGVFQHPTVVAPRAELPAFRRVTLPDGKGLFVSDLVTIAELRLFLAETGYENRRVEQIDRIEPPNRDAAHLPAAVNYFDALAYTAWLERKNKRVLRLLRIDEYVALHPGAAPVPSREERGTTWPVWKFKTGCLEFPLPDGRVRESFGFIDKDDTVRFKDNLPWVTSRQGLRFLVSLGFGEWLFEHWETEAAAICTATLLGVHDHDTVARDFFPSSSWGKYRCCKIGFRLCYEADPIQ